MNVRGIEDACEICQNKQRKLIMKIFSQYYLVAPMRGYERVVVRFMKFNGMLPLFVPTQATYGLTRLWSGEYVHFLRMTSAYQI